MTRRAGLLKKELPGWTTTELTTCVTAIARCHRIVKCEIGCAFRRKLSTSITLRQVTQELAYVIAEIKVGTLQH